MKRWNYLKKESIESEHIDEFLNEISDVCGVYGLSFYYDEVRGCYIVEEYDSHNIKTLLTADVGLL